MKEFIVLQVNPLLADAREGSLAPAARGRLPGGVEGVVGHLSYRRGLPLPFRFNLAVTEVPDSTAFIPRLFCIRRRRIVQTEEIEGWDERSSRLWTESTILNRRYKIRTSPHQDQNWLRQLFSPEFVDWLAHEPPRDFSFELTYGKLVGSIEQNHPDVAALDALCEATAYVAERIRRECEE